MIIVFIGLYQYLIITHASQEIPSPSKQSSELFITVFKMQASKYNKDDESTHDPKNT